VETPKRTRVSLAASDIAYYIGAIVLVIVLGKVTVYLGTFSLRAKFLIEWRYHNNPRAAVVRPGLWV
jgi:hypothetical protein